MLNMIKGFITDFLSRHKNDINRILHILGIPLVLFGIFQFFIGEWKIGLANFFIGYLFQWIGHTYFEKNEVGEWILLKKIARKLKGR